MIKSKDAAHISAHWKARLCRSRFPHSLCTTSGTTSFLRKCPL